MNLAGYSIAIAVGLLASLLVDRMIVRLVFYRSLFWPGRDRCSHGHASLPWTWSIPVFGFFLAGRKCRACGSALRSRAMLVQLLTCSLIVGLYHLYFRQVGHGGPGFVFPRNPFNYWENHLQALWIYHSILMLLLVAATFIDFDWMMIPDSVTVPGMILGIGLGTFWHVELHPVLLFHPDPSFSTGLLSSRFFEDQLGWQSVPGWLESARVGFNEHWRHHWNAWLGFLTGMVGLLVGGGTVWVVRAICSWIFRVEAMGFGDVTLMAMIGSFVGWQTAVMIFFLAPVSAAVVGIFAYLISGQKAIPYGPHLSIAAVGCVLGWAPLWQQTAEIFEHAGIVIFMAGGMVVVLVAVASLIQAIKMLLFGMETPAHG
jgi:leader peptidase (prepilin peptidase) / N-methyltransferase